MVRKSLVAPFRIGGVEGLELVSGGGLDYNSMAHSPSLSLTVGTSNNSSGPWECFAVMIDPVEAAHTVVLLVEDEPLVRMCAADILEEEGFEVIEAATAPAALKVLEKRDDVAAVFTDIDMPGGMNGLDLARIIYERWPHIALVVTSGVCRVGADKLPGDGVFIGKPYAAAAPVRIIRELTRQRSRGQDPH